MSSGSRRAVCSCPRWRARRALGEKAEPVYPRAVRDDIQGNIVPGFNKDHQHFLFLAIDDVRKARRWLRRLAPQLTTMDDALAFVRAHRSARLRTGNVEPPLNATWINLAFSYGGIAKLAGAKEADKFGDQRFRQGLAERSTYLGDPSSPAHPHHRRRWKVGGPGREADIFVMVAADEPSDLKFAVKELMDGFDGVSFLFGQRCDTLPGNLRGHEHFGFKDGISQPGVRGRVSEAAGDYLTPRYLAKDDPHARLFAKPGQPLVWPGQFLLGEPRQDTQDLFAPAPAAKNFPSWARRGSYVVVRRLRQDVEAFWTFVIDHAGSMDPIHFAATLVGRWPSGAPLMRAAAADDPALGGRRVRQQPLPLRGPDPRLQALTDRLPRRRPSAGGGRRARPRLPALRPHPQGQPTRRGHRSRHTRRLPVAADAAARHPVRTARRGRRVALPDAVGA